MSRHHKRLTLDALNDTWDEIGKQSRKLEEKITKARTDAINAAIKTAKTEIDSQNEEQFLLLFLNMGFLVSFISFIIINLLSAHLPLLIITFEKLTIGEIFKTSFYITFRYFLTTLILFVLQLLIIVIFLMCIFVNWGILAVWLLFGISLPAFLQVKFTQVIYYKFSQIDFEKIMHQVDEEEEEE